MRRKIVSIALSAILVLGLIGCSSSSSSSTSTTEAAATATETEVAAETEAAAEDADEEHEPITLNFAWWGNQVRNDVTVEVLDLYSERNPYVSFDTQPAQFADYYTMLATSAAGNVMPDLLQIGYAAQLSEYMENGLLLDLNPYIESGLLDVSSISDSILDSGSLDGKLYAVCCGLNAPAVYYNKTLTDELGIEVGYNLTIDEFIDICREVYEQTGVKTEFGYDNEGVIEYILRGEGLLGVYNEDGTAFASDDELMFVPYFEIYQKGHEEGWMLDASIYSEIDVSSVEQCPVVYYSTPDTQAWCSFYWSNQMQAMRNVAPEGMDIEYTTWPAADPILADYLHPSMYFSVAASSANPEEAVKVLNYLINDIDCNNILLAERGIPAPSVVADAIAPNLPEASQMEIEFINDVVTPNSSTISPLAPSAGSEITSKAHDLTEEVLFGVKTAEEASVQLYNDGMAILAGN